MLKPFHVGQNGASRVWWKTTMCMFFEKSKTTSGFWTSDLENTCTRQSWHNKEEELIENQQACKHCIGSSNWQCRTLPCWVKITSVLYEKWEMIQIGWGGLVERAEPMCTLIQQDFCSICCQCFLMSSSPAQVWSVWIARDVVPAVESSHPTVSSKYSPFHGQYRACCRYCIQKMRLSRQPRTRTKRSGYTATEGSLWA